MWILGRRFSYLALLLFAVASSSSAETMYKYLGADGEWIYTDRKPPADIRVETRQIESSFVAPEFKISDTVRGREIEFVASNDFYAPIEVRLEFVEIAGISFPHPDERLRWVVEPRSDLVLLTLNVLEDATAPSMQYRYEFMPGDPSASHNATDGYRVPYTVGRSFPVSQAYPDAITHVTTDSRHAVDIAMPIGTNVFAARGGVVIEVASKNFEGGTNLIENGPDANIVRILHEDGTFALYAHLNWNSIRVKPGDRVAPGQYIADSGNTGYSTGPHLHFAVQRNAGLRVQSLPVVFRGANRGQVVPTSGTQLTAYP